MHNLGLWDAITTIDDKQQAVELLRVFTWYQFTESPELRAGQTFSVDAESDIYCLREYQGVDYGEESLFSNPYGTWELVPVGVVKHRTIIAMTIFRPSHQRYLFQQPQLPVK